MQETLHNVRMGVQTLRMDLHSVRKGVQTLRMALHNVRKGAHTNLNLFSNLLDFLFKMLKRSIHF